MYEPEEILAPLKACSARDRVLYLCYLLTGLRDKEMRCLTWGDVDFRTQVIRVTRKPLYGFKPKNKEEREVPVPAPTQLTEIFHAGLFHSPKVGRFGCAQEC